jgi:hypothetical protein
MRSTLVHITKLVGDGSPEAKPCGNAHTPLFSLFSNNSSEKGREAATEKQPIPCNAIAKPQSIVIGIHQNLRSV